MSGAFDMTSEAPKDAASPAEPAAQERGQVLQFRPRPAPKAAASAPVPSAFANLSRDTTLARDSTDSPAVRGLDRYMREREDAEDFSHRMKMNALAAIVLLALLGGGMWIVDVMTQMRRNQDCALSGQRNCTVIAAPSTSR
jgi:hypothetical protein